ncbi:TAXI family TRAP transporter solute-binding subunit [Rhodoblastus sp. 17X3]|uniref:TAXI family TRAP transporter solute-binding subunit n=1 Tax=Rhodoblastus sp. 17X3 TaxID=3047026 RepID=UPI0024B6E3D3|nr:TAXI family TRAP transporter solute-binding subunit [Rhodoblastus sp. 17X3]MDI9847730.1 TAXI family TRAP transporter solute-binding subunit [Rhodoblastus sp. 17X3]
MFGLFAKQRVMGIVFAVAFLIAAAALGILYLWSPHATLRITSGVEGSKAQRFISAFIKVAEAQHPRIKFQTVPVASLTESAKALEQGKADIAIIRSDATLPVNGETLVILRHDAVAVIVPHHSSISSLPDLTGKSVAIPSGPAQDDDSHALDLLLSFYNITPDKVKREFLAIEDIGPAIQHKRVVAAIAVGPVGPGPAVDTVASIAAATKGTPKVLGFDDADAIVKRFPMFESYDVPEGGFKGKPAVPDDTVTMLAVNYRFAVPITMLDIVADAIGRSILTAKAQLMNVAPMAGQIEAPDVSDQNPLLPIHPGFAAYLSNGDQSFFDQAQRYLYIFGIPLSIGASLITLLVSMFNARGSKKDRDAVERLLSIAHEASTADRERLETLEKELHEAVSDCVAKTGDAATGDQWKTQIVMQHAMRRFERRDAMLKAGAAPSQTPQTPDVSPPDSP